MEKEKLQDRKYISLKNLLLDPNNYRFIDNDGYKPVGQSELSDPQIQKRTRSFIAGPKNKNIEDLLKSFRANGYLEVDQIQVEALEDGKFRVLEGNRRITTLKILQERYNAEGADIGALNPKIFSRVPVMEVKQSRAGEHEMIMALKHISGNKKWATLNQAQLLHDLIHKYHWNEEQVCESIGITKHKLRRDLRTIAIIQQYKDSDYGDQFETEKYSIFREVISSQNIKEWIGWDEGQKKAMNLVNIEKLFNWLSEVEEIKEEEGKEINYIKKPIITKSDEVRILASFLEDEAAIGYMQATRNISKAYGASKNVGYDKFKNSLAIIGQQLQEASIFSRYSDEEDVERLSQLKKEFDALLVLKGQSELIYATETTSKTLLDIKNKQLQELTLINYKGFGEYFKIDTFNRVNLFAGDNNAGKTSLLEAIYILVHLNDIQGIYHVAKRRGKFADGVPTEWLNGFLPGQLDLKGEFDNKSLEVHLEKYNEPDTKIDKNEYLSTLSLKVKCSEQDYAAKIRLFRHKDMEQYYEERVNICSIAMSSPFIMLNKQVLAVYYENAVEKGVKDKIISFLAENIDDGILDIERLGEGAFLRFVVKHKNFDFPKDLTEFGDGVQRVFFIALMIASSQNGILCIDEIENAIHHNLLIRFTTFLQKLAEEFHVQLFISTHSNECIKAFFENGHKNEDITGFRMSRHDGGVKISKAEGLQLQKQIERFSLDLRG